MIEQTAEPQALKMRVIVTCKQDYFFSYPNFNH